MKLFGPPKPKSGVPHVKKSFLRWVGWESKAQNHRMFWSLCPCNVHFLLQLANHAKEWRYVLLASYHHSLFSPQEYNLIYLRAIGLLNSLVQEALVMFGMFDLDFSPPCCTSTALHMTQERSLSTIMLEMDEEKLLKLLSSTSPLTMVTPYPQWCANVFGHFPRSCPSTHFALLR